MINIHTLIEPDMMPLCPLCDQPIWDYEDKTIVSSGGVTGLAHYDCTEDAIQDMIND